MKTRKESFFGIHCDFHAKPSKCDTIGATLREEDIREICQTLKPDFIQIDCKGHPGWASYPSKIGNAMPNFVGDPLALWRKVTREEGVALYMHYSGVYDIKYCDEHPEECTLRADGKLDQGTTRLDGKYVDELLIPQLCELAEKYEVDGFWVDGECWRATTDFHPETLAAFEKATGIDLGGKIPATKEDEYYFEYKEYHRELFRKYLRHYVDTLHEKFPNLQITSNWAFSDHMPEKVSANVDYLSGDFSSMNSFNSARYAGRALAQQNYAWDLMSWNFRIKACGRATCVTKHDVQMLQEAAAVLSLGGAYQNYVMQNPDGSPQMHELRNLKKLSEFVRERKEFCFRGKIVHQAAILLSTYDRAREMSRLYSRNGYKKVIGLTALMADIGQSFEIVGEHTLEGNCNDYKMIVIPELYYGLAPETVKELLDYAKNGGKLVLVGKNTCNFFANMGAPFTYVDHSDYYEIGKKAYDNGGDDGHGGPAEAVYKSYYFSLDNEKFGTFFSPCEIQAENGTVIASLSEEMRGKSYPLAVTVPHGSGSVTAIGFDVGSQYMDGTQYLHRTLMKTVADSLYIPMLKVENALGFLEVVCLEKEGKLMLQLLNANGHHSDPNAVTEDFISPIVDIKLSIELDANPEKLILQPEGRELAFEYKDGRAYVELNRLDIHSVIEVVK